MRLAYALRIGTRASGFALGATVSPSWCGGVLNQRHGHVDDSKSVAPDPKTMFLFRRCLQLKNKVDSFQRIDRQILHAPAAKVINTDAESREQQL